MASKVDRMNRIVWECTNCGSIIKTKEDVNLQICGSCKKATVRKMGRFYSYERKKISEEILRDPDLFDKITVEEFNKKIVGEVEARKVIFLCGAGGRLVENCQIASYNVLVNDEAGSGKDYVTSCVLQLLPEEVYIHKTRISPTAFTYWKNAEENPTWTWDGKVFYPEDISEVVLNSDVFKVMCSSGSTATIVIKQRAVDLEIKGKPVMITTTATATPNPELTRRFVILNLDSSEKQTKAIMKRHLEYAEAGIIPEYNKDYTYAMGLLKRVKVKIPYTKFMQDALPSKSIIMRTHLPRFLDYIKASAAFHQYQREEKEGFILANEKDYEIARECFLKLTSNKFMIPLTINQKKILEVFSKNPKLKGTVTELHANHMNFISDRALQTNLGILAKYGILKSFSEKDSMNRAREFYCLSGEYKPNEEISIPTFKELCRITSTSSTSSTSSITSISSISSEIPLKKGDTEDTEDIEADLYRSEPATTTTTTYENITPLAEKVKIGEQNG